MVDSPPPGPSLRNWVFLRGMIGWGVPVTLLAFAWSTWGEGQEATVPRFLVTLGTYLVAGMAFGLTMWWWSRRQAGGSGPGPDGRT